MKGILFYIMLWICILTCYIATAQNENRNSVQFLKYNNDEELEQIQRDIIAQYEQLGGSSQFHQIQSASFVDPQHININL